MRYDPEQQRGTAQGTIQCPTCGMHVSRTLAKCPQDGTPLMDAAMGAFAQRYEFLEALGTGGMSVIYKARHRVLNRIIAIKMMHEHMMNEQAVRRFQQEGQAASSLDHPNIVKVHDFGLTDRGQPYMVMDLVEGRSLSQVLDELGELPITQCLMIFIDICDALIHAHGKGILHRDLKPSNIMLTTTLERPMQAKLVDFGIAKIMDGDTNSPAQALTQTGELFGSPPYMSPEQCYGKKVDRRSDIYSLGCLMFECLTGRTPFRGDTIVDTLSKQMTVKAPLLHEVRANKTFPLKLEDLVDKCLAKNPDARFKNVEEVKAQLLDIQAAVDEGQQKDKLSARQILRTISQFKSGALLLVIGLLGLGGIGFVITYNIASHNEELRNIYKSEARFLALMKKDAITTPILAQCLKTDAGLTELELNKTKINNDAIFHIKTQKKLQKLNLAQTGITDGALLNLKSRHQNDRDSLQQLEDLNLSETNIEGAGLPSLGVLPALKKLNLHATKITADSLDGLKNSRALEELNLSYTGITGPCLGLIQQLPKLHALNISGTKLKASDLSSLPKSSVMTTLALSDCSMNNSAISYLTAFPELTSLEIHWTKFDDGCAADIAKLAKLRKLDLAGDKFTNKGLEALLPLRDLYEIHLRDVEIDSDTMKILKKFPNLHVLDLAHCWDVDDNMIKQIAEIKTIDSLNIALDEDSQKQSKLTPHAITIMAAEMPQLKDLNLRKTKIIDKDSLSELAKLKNLRHLDLRGMYLEASGKRSNLDQLRSQLPLCESIEHDK